MMSDATRRLADYGLFIWPPHFGTLRGRHFRLAIFSARLHESARSEP